MSEVAHFSLESRNGVILGEVPGIVPGRVFPDRRSLHDYNVHRGLIQGIAPAGSSVVLNGGYEDDEDQGAVVIYTGEGGQPRNGGPQIADQKLTKGNLALAQNCERGIPVRVVRGYKNDSPFRPASGYRYDGLYRIERYWSEVGKHGFRIWRYRLEVLDEKGLAALGAEPTLAGSARRGESVPGKPVERREAVVSRVIRNTRIGQQVKEIHDYTCQICGTRVMTQVGPYAECCHIRPLGRPHNGPDVLQNVLCLCPNCHVAFDGYAVTISDEMIVCPSGVPLRLRPSHSPSRENLEYHRGLKS